MIKCLPIFLAMLFFAADVTVAHSANLVVPQSNTAVEGLINSVAPFGELSMRYQQVYDAKTFSPINSPIQITQIAFRPDAEFGEVFSTTQTAQIDLSTTQNGADNLNPTYALNIGPDDVTVFPEGQLILSSADTGPSAGPKDFDIVINLTAPFTYNPANGNLLLDVRIYDRITAEAFDATFYEDSSDGVSRQFSSVNNATSDVADSSGLITKFTFTPVPEPSTLALLTLGGMITLAAKRRRPAPGC